MNIYEYLNMPSRGAKVTQLTKHWDDVPDSRKSFPYLIQDKMDGVHSIIIVKKDDNGLNDVTVYSRTGKALSNTYMVEFDFCNCEEGVYMAELCTNDGSLEVLSGILNPNRVEELSIEQGIIADNLKVYVFDYLTLSDFKKGSSDTDFSLRLRHAREAVKSVTNVYVLSTRLISNEEELYIASEEAVGEGEEGIVIKMDTNWLAGHKGYRQMKIVKGVSYDLICIDYEEGTGKYEGLVANLIFDWKGGRKIKAMLGKGWTHDKAKLMFDEASYYKWYHSEHNMCDDVPTQKLSTPIGKMYKVTALQESSKGVLRLPKVGELRIDKETPDVESTYKGGRN